MIRKLEVIPYALPFREPYVTARGRLERRELILIRVTDADGVVGLGETTSLSLRGGRALAEIAAELEAIAAICAAEPAGVSSFHLSRELGSNEARCALAIALMDLELPRKEAPVPEPVPCNATLSAGTPAAVAEEALRWRELGFETFKLKVGPEADVGQVVAVREALGPEGRIRVDANGTWDMRTATAALHEIEELDVELCEQPVTGLDEMAKVAAKSSIPLAGDESVREPEDAERARALGACALATLKLAKVGGPVNAERGEWGMPIYLSSALDGPVGIAAAARVAASMDAAGTGAGIAHGLATQLLFAETIAAVGPSVRDGKLHIPPGPGLGVEIDDTALAAHRLNG